MKRRYTTLLLMTLLVFGFASCERFGLDFDLGGDEDNKEETGGTGEEEKEEDDIIEYEILSDDTYRFDEFITDLINNSSLTSGLPELQKLMVTSSINSYVLRLKSLVGLSDEEMGFRRVTYLYDSTDQYGEPVTLSSMALWLGSLNGEVWSDISPNDIMLMQHYTITSNAECPSVGYPFEAFINGNSLVIMPDYTGYGATKDMLHPYLNHEVCASNSIDALLAGYALFDEISSSDMNERWTTIVAGASQGGGNALAVHKYMDTNPDFAEEWNFSYSYCASGPYDPALTVELYLEAGKTDHPVLFPLTLESMRESYPESFGRFEDADIYSENYLEHKSIIDEALQSKQYTTAEMNRICIEHLKVTRNDDLYFSEILLEDILSQQLMDTDSEVCKALFECLRLNDLTSGWTPAHPIKLYYSEIDKVVPHENALDVLDAFGSKYVKLVKSMPLDHGTCCALWMLDVMNTMVPM
ncbi:MAG: hypothetical protein IKU36_07075 [Bacteroidales bacterium]|nr:hypothetical protein [Bacteroidales bacterium]